MHLTGASSLMVTRNITPSPEHHKYDQLPPATTIGNDEVITNIRRAKSIYTHANVGRRSHRKRDFIN